MSLTVRWSNELDEITALEGPWRELQASVTSSTPFASVDYLLPWYRHYAGRSGRPLVGSAWEGAALMGLAPLVMRPGRVGGIPVQGVQFAAAGAEAGEFLLAEGRPELAGAFLESLATAVRFDVARFNLLDPASAEFEALRQSAARCGVALETVPTSYATVDLSGGYEAYRARMSRNFRRNLKRIREGIEAVGPIGIEGVRLGQDRGVLESSLDRMFVVSDASWKARRGGPMADHHRGFYREVARRFGAQGRLDLAILQIRGRDRAYMLGVAERGVYYDVTLSFDDAVRDLSPGTFLTQAVLRRLAGVGIHMFVSHGVHDYKLRFASAIVPRRRAFVFARRPRATLSRTLRFSLAPLWERLGLLPASPPGSDPERSP